METHSQRDAHSDEAATYEPASPADTPQPMAPRALPAPPPRHDEPPEPPPFEFASEAEEDAYWAGVTDGVRTGGDKLPPRLAARARDRYPELIGAVDSDALQFDPVSIRHRVDGWTPEKQREYVEALADTGVARYAAARVGMTEQSANRLRRRPGAHSFDLACAAAQPIGARNLVSVACTRAIEGTMRKHYWRGEVVGEDRVYDNRLLVSLITRVLPLLQPEGEAAAVAEHWGPFVDALGEGRPAPDLHPQPASLEPDEAEFDEEEDEEDEDAEEESVWQESDGIWWTSFPPPEDFVGEEINAPWGSDYYRRTLSDDEQDWAEDNLVGEYDEELAEARAERDAFFGFAGDGDPFAYLATRGPKAVADAESDTSHTNGAEPYELSSSSPSPDGEGDQVKPGGGAVAQAISSAGSALQPQPTLAETLPPASGVG